LGLFDTILGRTKPVKANLDNLFALAGAAVTLQVSAGLVSTHKAGVCFKPPAGQPFAEVQAQIEELLEVPDQDQGPGNQRAGATAGAPALAEQSVRHVQDSFGYRWILVEGGEVEDLVTRVHMVHSSLEDAGWSTQLLCSVFGFAPGGSSESAGVTGQPQLGEGGDAEVEAVSVDRPIYLVYLAKRGSFYPFAPTGPEKRDNELELRLKGLLGNDLPVETDLTHWFPIWDLPIA
jgi:PspA associated protein B